MRLLLVCTGNLCRSPLAERLVRAWSVRARGVPLSVSSAGVAATPGLAMDGKAAAALRRLGGDPAGFVSRPLSETLLRNADLVLTMTRRQRSDVLELAPRGLRRTFTLLEASALLDIADLGGLPASAGTGRTEEVAARLDAARRFRASTGADDVPDPIGASGSVHRQVAGRIAAGLRPLADVLLATDQPTTRAPGAAPAPVLRLLV